MCTLLLAVDVWDGTRLVVAANRDEVLDRPASGPQLWERGGRRFFAPRDEVAGGSWIGVTESGLFVGITNRSIGGGPSVISPDRRSRGALVLDALSSTNVADAIARVRDHGPEAHNPFHLALADEEQARVIWSDGWTLHEDVLNPGRVHVVTERSYGAAPSGRDDFLRAHLARLGKQPEPSLDSWRALLSTRHSHAPDDMRAAFDDVCVSVPAFNYGTRSSSWVRLNSAGHQRFAWIGAPPHRSPFEELTDFIPWA